MENKEQVKLAQDWLEKDRSVTTKEWGDIKAGLSAINNKARAWDALEKLTPDDFQFSWCSSMSGTEISNSALCAIRWKMNRLLAPPQPKDPLEELQAEIKRLATWPLGSLELMISVDKLLEVVNKTIVELKKKQTDPLGELEEFIESEKWRPQSEAPGYVISASTLLSVIRRLRGEK
jgi:hypothetical protein